MEKDLNKIYPTINNSSKKYKNISAQIILNKNTLFTSMLYIVLYFSKIWGLRALSGFYIVSPKDVGEVIDPFEKISQNIEGLEML